MPDSKPDPKPAGKQDSGSAGKPDPKPTGKPQTEETETDTDEVFEEERSFDITAEIDEVRAGVVASPPPGSDPDSKLRMAKHLAAAGVDLPSGYSTDPVTDEDREAHAMSGEEKREQLVREAAQSRKMAAEDREGEAKTRSPQGRASQQDRQHSTGGGRPSQTG